MWYRGAAVRMCTTFSFDRLVCSVQESLGRIASLADMSAEDLKASMEEEDSTAMEDQLGEDISDSDVDANNSF